MKDGVVPSSVSLQVDRVRIQERHKYARDSQGSTFNVNVDNTWTFDYIILKLCLPCQS